ncbi:MAG: alpha/beta hydrolase domain-containing protein [Acidimicrobiales bacterium]
MAEVVEVASPIPVDHGVQRVDQPGPQHRMNAAVHALTRWVTDGTRPPSADRMQVVDAEVDPAAEGRRPTHKVTDATATSSAGSAPPVVPVAPSLIAGRGRLVLRAVRDHDTVRRGEARGALPRQGHVPRCHDRAQVIDQSVREGFILPADAELILRNAADNDIGR